MKISFKFFQNLPETSHNPLLELLFLQSRLNSIHRFSESFENLKTQKKKN